jgi:chemotaxis protein CheX
MNLHERISGSIVHATLRAFSTMLGSELGAYHAATERGMPQANDGIASFIGLAGSWAGTGCITCSSAVACRIFSQMLQAEADTVDEDVLDAIAELTNIVIGSVKTDLETHVGPLGLSLPTVVFGRDFITRNTGQPDWTTVRFPADGGHFTVKMCLSRMQRQSYVTPHTLGQTCTIER